MPDLAKGVQSTHFMEEHLIDAVLWTSLCSFLLDLKSDAPGPQLKLHLSTKPKAGDPVVKNSMAERICSWALESQKGCWLSLKGTMPYDVSSKTDEYINKLHEKFTRHYSYLLELIMLSTNSIS